MWIFRKQPTRLSSDRLKRFIRTQDHQYQSSTDVKAVQIPGIFNTLSIGDWCAFLIKSGELRVAQVLCFQLKTSNGRYKPFKLDTAPAQNYGCNEVIVVHGSFYKLLSYNKLIRVNFKHPLRINYYSGHINPPKKNEDQMALDESSLNFVNELLTN